MDKTIATAAFLILSSFLLTTPVNSQNCRPVSCRTNTGPLIRFPFRLTDRQNARCGYPGFDLSCNSLNETILNLPGSGEFVVDYIDYMRQALFINDPGSCLPSRLLNFTLSGSRFLPGNSRDYTFLNCSGNYMDYPSGRFMPLYCMSEGNNTVLAMDSHRPGNQVPETCRRIGDVSVPMQWAYSMFYWSSMDLREDLELLWRIPGCRVCESRGGNCGYRGDSGLDIGCSLPSRRGLPRGARYGLIIGIGVPGVVCIIGLICYSCGMLKSFTGRDPLSSDLPITSVSAQRLAIRTTSGLDGPTIESYPKTVLGASRRLPKPSDVTCPICLADYLPEETLRTIPECNHYFHAECIDEWLKLNGTCPLCRNSPQTPSTSSSHSSFSISSSVSTNLSDR